MQRIHPSFIPPYYRFYFSSTIPSGIYTIIGHTNGVLTIFRKGGWYHDSHHYKIFIEQSTSSPISANYTMRLGPLRTIRSVHIAEGGVFRDTTGGSSAIYDVMTFRGSKKGSVGALLRMRRLYVLLSVASSADMRSRVEADEFHHINEESSKCSDILETCSLKIALPLSSSSTSEPPHTYLPPSF